MTKIYLSPSSQFGNTYSYGGYNEAQVCGLIAQHAYDALKRNGFDVKLGSINKSMEYRTKESNDWGADYHVPIHTNAGGGQGTVVFAWHSSVNDKYVKAVYNALAALSPGKDRGIKEYDALYEINMADGVTIYVEAEFHDNADLAKWIVENVEQLGEAIAKGFCEAEGKAYIAKTPAKGDKMYYVQTGAFTVKEYAEAQLKEVKAAGFKDAYIKTA